MKRSTVVALLMTALWISAARAQAPDATDAIKPFVNEFTVAAARVDLGTINFDALDRWSGQVIDAAQFDKGERAEVEQQLRRTLAQARQWAADFKKAGGSTVWVLWSIESLPTPSPMFIVVPIGPGVDAQQIRKLLAGIAPGGPDHPEILEAHDALVIPGDRGGLDWIKHLKPAPRPELAGALSAAGDGILQMALIPSPDARKVAESMAPPLPDGQPASVLARGIVWAALSARATPDITGRLIIQSPDQQSAADLIQSLKSFVTWGRQSNTDPRTKLLINSLASLVDQMQIHGNRLELIVGDKEFVSVAADISRGWHVAREAAVRTQSIANIKQLMLGCIMYANNDVKNHLFPETLDAMLKQEDIAPSTTINSRRPEQKPGYVYVKPPEPAFNVPADRLVIYENFKDFDGGVAVGFGDGHVEFINNEGQFRKLLDEAHQKQKQATGPNQ